MIFVHKVKFSNIVTTIPIKCIFSCTEKLKSLSHKASSILSMYLFIYLFICLLSINLLTQLQIWLGVKHKFAKE